MESVERLNDLFQQLKLKAEIKSCKREDPFLIFDIILKPGGTFKKLEKHITEFALALKALSEPLIYPVTKEGIIRMEIMESEQKTVFFNDIKCETNFLLPMVLGQFRNGEPLIADLVKMPHLLISGSTGSGKSILLHSIINSLLDKASLVLIDPKRVEFSYYSKLPNLYTSIARDVKESLNVLEHLIEEMENRFSRLEKAGARDISDFEGKMPFIVVVIDELADLMMAARKESQDLVCRLAQKSRACGIHLVVATQRPSVDIITGVIKANFPARISCRVSSLIDSRVVLGCSGAEKLLGRGDALVNSVGLDMVRFQGAYISPEQIEQICKQHKRG